MSAPSTSSLKYSTADSRRNTASLIERSFPPGNTTVCCNARSDEFGLNFGADYTIMRHRGLSSMRNERRARRGCPAARTTDLCGLLRHQAADGDQLPVRLRLSCQRPRASAGRGRAAAAARPRAADAADARLQRAAIGAVLPDRHAFIVRYQPPELQPLIDEDVAEGVAALARRSKPPRAASSTSTAPASLPGERLCGGAEAGARGGWDAVAARRSSATPPSSCAASATLVARRPGGGARATAAPSSS